MKRLDEALNEFEGALRLERESVPAWLGLGETYEHKGFLRQAKACYRNALTFSPEDAGIRAKFQALERRLPRSTGKVRIYDLAKEMKVDTKRLIEEVRREGIEVAVPSNSISGEMADKLRDRYFPIKLPYAPPRRVVVVKKARPVSEETVAPSRPVTVPQQQTKPTVRRLVRKPETLPAAEHPQSAPQPMPPATVATTPVKVPGAIRLVRRKDIPDNPADASTE